MTFYERRQREATAIAELETKIRILNQALMSARDDLDAIFTRIERGDECELHMRNGFIYVIKGELRG